MSIIGVHFHLEIVGFIKHVTSVVQKKRKKSSIDGKRNKARRIVIKASVELSHIQPTLDDKEKARFCRAIDLIGAYFEKLDNAQDPKSRKAIVASLLDEVMAFENRVMTTSTMQMAKIAVEGREARAYQLYQKYSKDNMDPIKVIQHIKEQLQDQPASNCQGTKPRKTPNKDPCRHEDTLDNQLRVVDAVMEGLENVVDGESCIDMDTT